MASDQLAEPALPRPASIPPQAPALHIDIAADPATGYAAIQNNLPVLRSVTLTNKGDTPIDDVEVRLACSPAFALETRLHFERLAAGETRHIAPIDLKPDHGYLAALDEAVRGALKVTVSAGGQVLAEAVHPVEVLAYDQWAGTRTLPELLAAFCMPNSPVVDGLIAKASALLRSSAPGLGMSLSMSGYQSKNREHAWKQMSAIYSTIAAGKLHYSNPPASFGSDGQKIRTPERILDTRVATCLDLVMLFASCLEQAGLHPVVLLKEGHAWVGAWLVEATFPTAVVDDLQSVRKRVKSGELMVFETTVVANGAANGAATSLRAACKAGEDLLLDDTGFSCAIDVRRAREAQIRPLPSRSAAPGPALPVLEDGAPAVEAMPALPPLDPAALPVRELAADTPEGRLAQWKSRLLDLTLRNRLLNFKPSKTTLRVVCPDLGALEDTLSEGKEFKLRATPPLMTGVTGVDTRDAAVYAERNHATPLDALAADALARGEIVVDSTLDALDARLLELFRAASTGLEEGGANTLYLAFGFLQWQEGVDAEASHLAPILLVPVTLSRQSVRSGFRLARHDDEALVNPTLRQKLAQDFSLKLPSFETLPLDEKGIDVGAILQTFRLHVGELKGWEVRETVELGIFSFTKYLMWKDLQDRHAQLQENSVVAHLINNPGKAFAHDAIGFEARTLDETHRPQDLFAPMLSDSSQLRAICAASGGKNLVIEGPPGTGKSQTITNLITHLLATGRTVLFVSEKMAALDVVHRRLGSLGLGAFCLELHSAKARKADVLKQLGTALDAAGTRTVREWELEAGRLWALRQDLNGVAAALHKVHGNDLTIYDAIGTTVGHPGWRPAPMGFASLDAHSRSELDGLRETCRQMAALAGQLGAVSNHPLAQIAQREWTPAWEQDLLQAAATLEGGATRLHDAAGRFFGLLGLDHGDLSLAELAVLDELAEVLLGAPQVPVGVARAAHDEAARARLSTLRRHGLARAAAWDALGGGYREDTAALDAPSLRAEWTAAQQTWWPKSWFAKRAVLNRLQACRADGLRPLAADMPGLLDSLASLNREDRAIEAMASDAGALLQDEFARHNTDWNQVEASEQWAARFATLVLRLAGADMELAALLRQKLGTLVIEQRGLLAGDMAHGRLLLACRDAWRAYSGQLQALQLLAGGAPLPGGDESSPAAMGRLLAMLGEWRRAARQLQPWCLWQRVRHSAVAGGLQGVVAALEENKVPLAKVADYFEFSYRNWWVRKAIGAEPVLCAFSSADHERKIREFRQADERFQKLSQQYVVARLAGQIPVGGTLAPGADSEMGKLRRELQKQRKHMPVRQLVQNLPTLMPRLKPCLLMSPLSVAQYLDAGHAQFDVVIFDEASQIPVWDAVGAIARGRQLVCVGDPKQLPPTSFFSKTDSGDEDAPEADLQDLESILDECLGIGMPQLTLQWHYRSKHESLITFSNVTYYDNSLITFPSPYTNDTGVRFERVHGVYDRGGSRTNRAEAEAIVDAIGRHYLDAAKRRQTVGVVTFNQAQQNLIERLLDERRRAQPELDVALAQAQASAEPLFIKNLENVQGDERDIIYFSITYGPDAAGKVSLNFGPLNLEGGHRRLNVAISRARQQVVIFSTLMPEQIDLSRVRASGVRDLKHYLEFAIRGPRALVEQRIPTGREPDSPFERQVIALLRERGWEVHPQVGVSGYRIDIGVVDPRAPGRYLLGVECDGASYHSAATARDRDRLRQHVLEGLGWEMHRIWSTDWWIDPEVPAQRLIARLEALVSRPLEGGPDTAFEPESGPDPVDTLAEDAAGAQDDPAAAAPAGDAPSARLLPYQPTPLDRGDPELFFDRASIPVIRAQLVNVIRNEGPVMQPVLFKRLARAWGLARLGKRIEEHLSRLVPRPPVTGFDASSVYWPEDADPATWEGFRVPHEDPESRRGIDDISLEELGNAAAWALSQQGAMTVEGLARTVCRVFGISRTTADAEARITRALSCGVAASRIAVEGGIVRSLR
ncbi:MAG: putative helicase [Massilia sp.]|nr:putative helicase [Massilia sp.]